MPAILVLTNVASIDDAKKISRYLIEQKLCACVNISAKCYSVYQWQNQVEEAQEFTLLIKTTTNKYIQLEQAIKVHHPYEVPEIIALSITQGSSAYLAWIDDVVNK